MAVGILLPYQKTWVEDNARLKLWLAARQIGKSFGTTTETVLDTFARTTTWVYLSVGERQSLELANKAKLHIEAVSSVAEEIDDEFVMHDEVKLKKTEIVLPNRSRHKFCLLTQTLLGATAPMRLWMS